MFSANPLLRTFFSESLCACFIQGAALFHDIAYCSIYYFQWNWIRYSWILIKLIFQWFIYYLFISGIRYSFIMLIVYLDYIFVCHCVDYLVSYAPAHASLSMLF